MLARRLLFVHQRSRSRLAAIYAALLSLASLGLAGFAAVHWHEPSQASNDRSSPPDAEVRPVDGIVAAPPQGRESGTRKRWM